MSLMIVARFDSLPSAKSAAHALVAEGIPEESVRLFRRARQTARPTPFRQWSTRFRLAWRAALLAAFGTLVATFVALVAGGTDVTLVFAAVIGACMGASMGAWWAGRWLAAWRMAWLQRVRESGQGALLAVQVSHAREDAVLALLRDAGGFQIDLEYGAWCDGRWVERGPGRREKPHPRAAAPRMTQWQL
ncbi:hypothetical protein [Bordetella sp. 02P26C-1]|uniref:hypothetical protein n=1 Tax=Bordetella sp. 02P26C-1 TaxID=2683195 RepID=UPI001353FE99|nr:hypothetical protein [Bordetella sp. 02P26C-1]MVW80105.1 hypothetical protein [Bordetella sp. 02P26C-1]